MYEGGRTVPRGGREKTKKPKDYLDARKLDNAPFSQRALSMCRIPSTVPGARIPWWLEDALFAFYFKEKETFVYVCVRVCGCITLSDFKIQGVAEVGLQL